MPVQVLLTLDLFLRRWAEDDGELWACVQPHVAPADLTAWVDRSETGAELAYAMVPPQDHTMELVPVTFPDVSDLSLVLDTAGGSRLLTNRRRTGMRVTDAGREMIASDNREPARRSGSSPGEAPLAALYPGPFSLGYNRTLRDAKAGRLNGGATDPAGPEELSQMLRVAFWGGTTRRIRQGAVEEPQAVHLMQLAESVPEMLVTNLHGLNGLMLRLGRRHDDLAFLLGVRDLTVILHGGDPTVPQHTVRLGADPIAAPSIPAYFSHLAEPLDGTVTAGFVPLFARRVYAVDNATAFSPLKVPGKTWFQRRRERPLQELGLALRDVTRLVVHTQGDFPAAPQPLQWHLYETLEGRLQPYRSFPVEAARTAGRGAVMRLAPAAADRDRFEQRLAADPRAFEKALVLQPDGSPVDLEWLGVFTFPWDQEAEEMADAAAPLDAAARPALLAYVSKVPAVPTVTLAVLQEEGGQAIVLTAAPAGLDPAQDHHGRRWEADLRGNVSQARFDILECLDTHGDSGLVPAVCVRGDAGFEFAQSAGKIEGQITVTYPPEPPMGKPEDFRPKDDYVEDLINHNALNLFAAWGTRPRRWLNPFGELYPAVPTHPVAGGRANLFHFGYGEEVFLPPHDVTPGPAEPFAARFFAGVYTDLGASREVTFDLEHTYGTRLTFAASARLATHADFPVSRPTAAVRSEPAPGEESESHFITVAYRQVAGEERAVLQFLTAWLAPALYQDEEQRPLHLAAWRAVAELATAERIALAGRFRRFEFRAALQNPGTTSLAAGLRPVKVFEDQSWDITAELGGLCRTWLQDGAAHVSELAVTLTRPGGARISDLCNVIELRLEVTRQAAKAPATAASSWDLVRPLPFLDNATGQAVEPVTDPEVVTAFGDFLASLRSASGTLEGSEEERKAAEILRKLLGEADPDAGLSGSWLVPEGFTVQSAGEALAALCPLSFLPLERDSYLADGTFQLLGAYLRALQAALDCRSEDWAKQRNAADWRAHVMALRESLPGLGRIAVALTALSLPLPDPARPGLDPEVRAVVAALRGGDKPAASFRGWLARQIWSDFALFAAAKALLFTRLAGAGGALLPEDFFQLDTERKIRDGREGEPPLLDHARRTFRQGLASLATTPWFGIAEVLDDVRYDNELVVDAFRLPSFEGVLAELGAEKPPAAGRDTVPLAGNSIHLPDGAQNLGAAERIKVALASREPVVAPVHVFTGDVARFQATAGSAALRRGDRLLLKDLVQGAFNPDGAGEILLEARTEAFARSARRDDTVVTAVFSVRGDEEKDWTNAFNNDQIFVDLQRMAALSLTALAAPADPPSAVKGLFAKLSAGQTGGDVLAAALAAEPLAYVAAALRPQPPSPATLPGGPRILIREKVPGQEVELTIAPGTGGRLPAEALFLRSLDTAAGQPAHFFLVVNVEAPLWFPVSLGLVQTRNLDRGFAPEFGQVSQRGSDSRAFQPFRVDTLVDPRPVSLKRDGISLVDVVRTTLVEPGILILDQPAGEEPYWTRFDLSVTVYHAQTTSLLAGYRDPGTGALKEQERGFSSSVFPLRSLTFAAGDKTAQETGQTWLPGDYTDYTIDFQWSSASNLQFFRLQGVRVVATVA